MVDGLVGCFADFIDALLLGAIQHCFAAFLEKVAGTGDGGSDGLQDFGEHEVDGFCDALLVAVFAQVIHLDSRERHFAAGAE